VSADRGSVFAMFRGKEKMKMGENTCLHNVPSTQPNTTSTTKTQKFVSYILILHRVDYNKKNTNL